MSSNRIHLYTKTKLNICHKLYNQKPTNLDGNDTIPTFCAIFPISPCTPQNSLHTHWPIHTHTDSELLMHTTPQLLHTRQTTSAMLSSN